MVSHSSQLAKQLKAGIMSALHLELRCYCCNHRHFELDNLPFIKLIEARIIAVDMIIIAELVKTAANLVDIAAAKELAGIAIIKRMGYTIVMASHILAKVHCSFHCTAIKLAAIELIRI